jgi:5-aminopentanamidase
MKTDNSRVVRVSLLHMDPRLGQVAYNRALIETGIRRSAELGATWIVTPELAVCGYFFPEVIGTDWIHSQPDDWMTSLCLIAKTKHLNLIISQPDRDLETGVLYNCTFFINTAGVLIGKHRKITVHPGTEEGWSTPGELSSPVMIDGINVGLLICADIYEGQLALQHRENGAELLICPSAWGAKYGPGNRWEKRTQETGIPLWVCNRTGKEHNVDWTGGDSVVAKNGQRLLSYCGTEGCLLLFEWDIDKMEPISKCFEIHFLG